MATEKRSARAPLREHLFGEFYRFSFYQAVALLESLAPESAGLGKELTPSREPVRFSVKPGFAFPPSDVAGLRGEEGGQPTLEAAFFGLVGPSGVLPHWYNEAAAESGSRKDGAMAAFLDIFQHRLLSLFYLAWKRYRFEIGYRPDRTDRLSSYLSCLMGLGTEQLSEKLALPAGNPIFYGGEMARGVPTAAAVAASVTYYSGVPAQVDQFVEHLVELAPEERTAIGKWECRLGIDTVCGSTIRENQSTFRLNLGPMPFKTYTRFLPGGDRLAPLFSLVRYQVGIEYRFELRVILNREEVPPCRLGLKDGGASRLGWSAWISSPGYQFGSDPHLVIEMEEAAGAADAGSGNPAQVADQP